MSRTYRNKDGWKWRYGAYTHNDVLTVSEWTSSYEEDGWFYYGYSWERKIDPKSEEGKKIIAEFHSDSKNWGNRRGPGWWINEAVQRPYRREAKKQIQKWMKDEDFEIQILLKPYREYWD